jgi:tungstate transport system permease protein
MPFIGNGVKQAWDLIIHGDPETYGILGVTVHVALVATLIALVIGVPIGLALGLGRFPGRGLAIGVANAGMGLPPVVVGLVLALLLFRGAPLGGLHWIYTLNGVILAQTVLALPIVIALTAAAVLGLPAGLIAQARAFGASRAQVAVLAIREARIGMLAATIAALGASLSEVGAVVLVGGNIHGETETLASGLLVSVSSGDYGSGIALGLILLGLIALLSAGLTVAQQRTARAGA